VKKDPSLKALIFDLGGVIVDLSVDHTLQAFSDLSGFEKEKVKDIYYSSEGFEAYEKGLITDDDFRNLVRETYAISSPAAVIDASWNAMIRGLPVRKLQLMEELMKTYSVYLLSNTNSIHIAYVNEVVLPGIGHHGRTLDTYFHRAYYSHIMKKRKPNADIFEQVLEENNLLPEHALFLDDNRDNIEGAMRLGIKTVHVTTPDLILDYFHE
jgi:glucose-1-phosphatase